VGTASYQRELYCPERFILKTPEVRDLFMSRIPLNRAAEPEEVSRSAIFLAAPASDFITGQIPFFDGGSTAG
jgi:NAD(P)-dependent dehydrogenase (short-subunit alcohol dehydrogenase family)